jgi:ribosomal protein S12
MKTIYERLDEILPIITDKRFRENKGLGNEIGYYIFDYDPEDEIIVREHIRFLKQKINNEGMDFYIRELDLYEIMIEILEQKGYLKKVFDMEKKKGTDAILKPIKNTLRLTQKNDLVVEYIREMVQENDVVFLTGIGKIWPIIRSHTVLNVLHSVIDRVPLIMFYPGTYSGQDLNLFDKISDQNYYRAFKLVER